MDLNKIFFYKKILNIQPKYSLAGIILFLVGGLLGCIFEYHIRLPGDFTSGLAALIIALII